MTSGRDNNPFGPTPFAAHLFCVANEWVSARGALTSALTSPVIWHDNVREQADDLIQSIRAQGVDEVGRHITELACARLDEFLAGVEAYQNFPRDKNMTEPPTIASKGSARLLHYGGAGPGVVFVPSLVNPAHVLDLMEGNSITRYLAEQGHNVYLIDWGAPDAEERQFSIGDYVAKRLIPLAESIGMPVTLAGYCMGGNLALAAAALRPGLVERLALLATPWDFHADGDGPAKTIAFFAQNFEPIMQAQGVLPAECLQMIFAALDPTLIDRKFRAFAHMERNSAQAKAFVALEDWSNTGAPLSAVVAREVFQDWYRDNLTAKGEWGGIRPEDMDIPTLAIIPRADRIVPPLSALALAKVLKAHIIRPDAGHVGMIVGSKACAQCWEPLENWLASSHVALSEITA